MVRQQSFLSTFPCPQLLSLNLSNNRLYRLDDMSSLVQKAPSLKILNLSGNEVRPEGLVVSRAE